MSKDKVLEDNILLVIAKNLVNFRVLDIHNSNNILQRLFVIRMARFVYYLDCYKKHLKRQESIGLLIRTQVRNRQS